MSRGASEWGAERVDVAAYRDRLGIDGPLPPTAATLRRIHRTHALTLPFENLDIVLGRGIDLTVEVVQDKMLRNGRGGYCYEQNMLLAALLERLGYPVDRLLARPLLDMPKPIPRTHLALRVEADGRDFLADVGFGDEGPVEPIPFEDGVVSEQGGWTYQLRRHGDTAREWVLSLRREGRWFPLYWLSSEPHHYVDCVVANYFISTHHSSPFVGRVFLERISPDQRINLNGRRLTRTRADGTSEVSEIGDGELPSLLEKEFGIHLTDAELTTVRNALPAID